MKWWWFNFACPPLKVEVPFASTSSCDDTFACLWNWHPQQHVHSHHHKQTLQWVQFQPHSIVGLRAFTWMCTTHVMKSCHELLQQNIALHICVACELWTFVFYQCQLALQCVMDQ
jgi:hypothetical protein